MQYEDNESESNEYVQHQPISSLMNKTLSLIEEEIEEDFVTNDEPNDKHYLSTDITTGIVKDIEHMERDFTRFLELIYN